METQIMPVNPCRTYKQYRTKMATHAKEVKLYEMNSPINLNIAKQKERNAKMIEECMVLILHIL